MPTAGDDNRVLPEDPGQMTDEDMEIAVRRLNKLLAPVSGVTPEQFNEVKDLLAAKP